MAEVQAKLQSLSEEYQKLQQGEYFGVTSLLHKPSSTDARDSHADFIRFAF